MDSPSSELIREMYAGISPHASAYDFKTWIIDIARYQDGISLEAAFDEAKAAGKHLVVIAKVSEGYAYWDPKFNDFYTEIMRLRSIGKYILFIAYHFCRMDKRADLQIQTIEKGLQGKQVDGFCLDCETTDGADVYEMTDIIWAISNHFKDYGAKKINLIYSRKYWWDPYVKRSTKWQTIASAGVAHWGVPASRVFTMIDWPTWTWWQAGQVNNRLGFKGDLDFGALNDNVNWFDEPIPPPQPPPAAAKMHIKAMVKETGEVFEGDLA